MATFQERSADVAALYIKVKKGPGDDNFKLRRLPYNLVTYDDGTSGLVPVNNEVIFDTSAVNVLDEEVDRVEVYEYPPFAGLNELK